MSSMTLMDWIYLVIFLVAAWIVGLRVRYWFTLLSSRRWPSTTATIQKGSVGRVSGAKGSWAFGSFFGYVFSIQEVRYAGVFALIANEEHAQSLQQRLSGAAILVRYKPNNPSVSFVVDRYDPRFEGLAATQSSTWLDQAPELETLGLNHRG